MNEENSMSVRFDSESRQSLEKANFDMKMKIYYMEEEMRKLKRSDGNSHSSEDIDDFKSEIESLRLRMQEKGLELEQRNNLLSKAKRAIEALKLRIDQLQNEETLNKNIQRELEKQVETINHSSVQLESGYKLQIKEYEEQLQSIRHQFALKENDYNTLDEKYNRLESASTLNDQRIMELCNHNNSLLVQLENLEAKHGTVVEELTQSLAHEDIYKLEVEEVSRTNRSLQQNVSELKQKVHEMCITHEGEMKEADMQSKLSHVEAMASIKEANYMELSKLKSEYEENYQLTKDFEITGLNRTVSELEQRVSDKADEVQNLRSIIEQDNVRYSNAMDEMEKVRSSLLDTRGSSEASRLESQIQREENQSLQNTLSELQDSNRNFNTRVNDLQHENASYASEIQNLKSQLIEATDTLESTHVMMKEYEMNLKSQDKDIQLLSQEKNENKTLAAEVSTTARENERLKIAVAQLEGEVKESTQIKLSLNAENVRLSSCIAGLEAEAKKSSVAMKDNDSVSYSLRQGRDQLEVQYQEECARANRLEAVLGEQRILYATSEKDLQEERRVRVQLERDCSSGEMKLHSFQRDLGKGCDLAYNAMLQWEDTLAEVLEPSIFSVRTGGTHVSSNTNVHANSNGRNSQSFHKSRNQSHLMENIASSSYMDISHIPQEDEVEVDGRQLLQNIISQITCMNKSMDRITRIRDKYVSTIQTIERTTTENAIGIANNKISVYSHKMEQLEKQMEQLTIVFNRDRKLHQSDVTEMKDLKEHVFMECADKIKDSELKYLSLKSLYDNEVRAHNQCKSELDQRRLELEALRKQEERLLKTEDVLRQVQAEYESVETKLEHYVENNQLLSYEVEDRGTKLESVCNELDKVIEERQAVMVVGERLRSQIVTRDELITKYETDILRMNEEITTLKSKQMDPSLAASIRQSQSLLQPKGKGGYSDSTSGNVNGSLHLEESMIRPPDHPALTPMDSPAYSRPSYPASPNSNPFPVTAGAPNSHMKTDSMQHLAAKELQPFRSYIAHASDDHAHQEAQVECARPRPSNGENIPQNVQRDEDDDITSRYNAIMARRKQQQVAQTQSTRSSDKILSSDLYSGNDNRQAIQTQAQHRISNRTPNRDSSFLQSSYVNSAGRTSDANSSNLMQSNRYGVLSQSQSQYSGMKNGNSNGLQYMNNMSNVNMNSSMNSFSRVGTPTPSGSFNNMGIGTPQSRLNTLGTNIDTLAKKLDRYSK